jgi:hypothetical protein
MALAGRKERANPARRPWPAWMLGSEEKSSAKWRSCGRACCSSCAISRQQQRHSATGQKPARGAHFPCRMDWTFAAKRASVSANVDAGPMGRGSRPAGNVATVGLRRWRRMCRRNQRDRLMSHSNILTNIASTTQPKRTAKRRKPGPALRRRRTKQERILALLRHPEGTTIAAFSLSPPQIGLALLSERIDRARVYRVTAPNASKQPARAVA